MAVGVAHDHAVALQARQPIPVGLGDLEGAGQDLADRLLFLGGTAQAGEQAVGGEDRQALIRGRAQEHEHVAVLALAAHLLGVDPRGFVAVVAVGDQQLGVCQSGLEGGDGVGVRQPPQAVLGAVGVGGGGERVGVGRRAQRGGGGVPGVCEQAEDGGQVGAGGAREPQPVLLWPRMRSLVRTDAARTVVLHAHAREEAPANALAPVRGGVALLEHPEGLVALAHENPLLAPVLEHVGGAKIGVAAVGAGEVELHNVERAALDQLGPHRLVDHVVGRRDDGLERAHRGGLVAKGAKRLDLGHGAPH
jgi:hypothetical protein